jgi:polysaccharide biosynthesis transport protein
MPAVRAGLELKTTVNPGNRSPLELRDYLSILWARKWIIVAVTATATAVAVYYSYQQTPVYTTSAEVLVRPARFDPSQPSAAFGFLNMQTEQQVANSLPVAQLASDHLDELGVAPGTVSAAIVEDAETIIFSSSASDAAAAQATADAFANAYLDLRRTKVQDELEAARRPYETQINAIDMSLRRIARVIARVDDEGLRSVLTTRYSSRSSERVALVQALDALASPGNVNVGDIVRSAALPIEPASPDHVKDAALGFIAGLILGIGVALLRDRLDDRVRGRGELELHSGAPVLAVIPRISSRLKGVITSNEPRSEAAEAYKALAVRLVHAAQQRRFKSVVITSSLPSEGKTTTTANLGVALTLIGKRVVMVSADLRRPRLQDYFSDGSNEGGLMDILVGKLPFMDALSSAGVPNLWILRAGQGVDSVDPLELLGSRSMKELLIELLNFADFVLIDTPPLLTSSDVIALAPFADSAMFVADPRLASGATIEQAKHELQLIGVPVVGVVVNKYDPRWFRSYGDGYGYYGDGREQGPIDSSRLALEAAPVNTDD